MSKGIIRLVYRKVIDVHSTHRWDKLVFNDTHQEYYMQAQYFDQEGKYPTFRELVRAIPNAERLHYLVSLASVNYLKQLDEKIPDLVDLSGRLFVPFKQYKFEILQSHIMQKEHHKIALYFYSQALTWIDTIGSQLLVSIGDQRETLTQGEEVVTELISLSAGFSVHSLQR
ncbi:MAG: hypothetical protein U0Y10_13690 [Spirosomataceae bacterium]